MENNLYDPNTMQEEAEHYTGEVIQTPVVKQYGIGAWLAGYTTTELRRAALLDAERERCRAYLTATAPPAARSYPVRRGDQPSQSQFIPLKLSFDLYV